MPALRSRLAVFTFLSLTFIALSGLVAAGRFDSADRASNDAFAMIYSETIHLPLMVVAVLGGAELTSLLVLGLAVFFWRGGYRDELWALTAFPVIVVLEVIYKKLLFHPGPPALHSDGPSLSGILESGVAVHNSYPSGHMARALFVYGLLAFVAHRLGSRRAGAAAIAAAVLIVVAVGFTRLYLAVHWESDVLGGMLLGGIGLLGATIWLDRPRPEGG